MKKSIFAAVLIGAMQISAAPTPADSPLWQVWDNSSPMIQEWQKLMQDEAWKDNTVGIDHTVPHPWTEVKSDAGKISVWGRDYIFDGKALPTQLTSQGVKMLASPVRFVALVNGKWETSAPGSGKIVESHPDQVIYQGETTLAGMKIKTRFTIEFDGFVWMEYTIGKRDAKVERVALEFPLNRDIAQWYRKQSEGFTSKAIKDRWGKLTGNKTLGPLYPGWATDFCLHNDKVGIDFTCEGHAKWLVKDLKRRSEWIVSDKEVIVRFNFIDNPPQGMVGRTKIDLGFNMMPFRPLDRELMSRFIYSWEADLEPHKYKDIVTMPYPPVRIISPYYWGLEAAAKRKSFHDGCAPYAIPAPRNPEKFIDYLKKLRTDRPGTRVVYYAVGDLHTEADPVFIANAEDWKGGPDKLDQDTVYGLISKRRGVLRKSCGLTKDFRDYKVFCLTWWADKVGLDGFYWDNQSFTACNNPNHPHHAAYDCYGRKIMMKPILQYREVAKRIYKTIKKNNPNAVFIGHETPPYSPFNDMVIDGEVLRRIAGDKQYYTRFVAPEDYNSVLFNSHIDGTAKSLLPEYAGKFHVGPESVPATNAMLAMLWMSDLNVWISTCNGEILRSRFVRPRAEFGIHDSEFIPFDKHEMAFVEVDKVYCTVFRKKDKVMVAVTNYNQTPVKDTLVVDLAALFPHLSTGDLYNIKAYDGESHAPVKMELAPSVEACLAEIPVEVGAENFRIFEFK